MRLLTCIFLSLALSAADLPDPTRDLNGKALLGVLATLRAPLAERPRDPAVWGAITKTYAFLALQADPDSWGAYGPWYDYAHRARAVLTEIDPHPANLTAALPGLWVSLLERDAVTIMAILDRLAPASTVPEVVALRNFAQGKADDMQAQTPLSALANVAAWPVQAALPSSNENKWGFLEGLMRTESLPHRAMRSNDPWATINLQGECQSALGSLFDDCVWMLQSSALDDATALRLLAPMASACGQELPAQATRQQALAQVRTGMRQSDPLGNGPALFHACWLAVAACRTGDAGWDDKRAKTLVGLGDVALWNEDRLLLVPCMLIEGSWNSEEVDEERVYAPLAASDGDLLAVRLGRLPRAPYQHNDSYEVNLMQSFTAALDEPTSTVARSPALAAEIALRIAQLQGRNGAGAVLDVIARRPAQDPRGLVKLAQAAARSGTAWALYPQLAWLQQRCPWHTTVKVAESLLDPAVPLFTPTSASAAATWIDAVINVQAPLTERGMPDEYAGIRWSGELTLPRPGTWTIFIASDDGSRLVVGDKRSDNPGQHGMQQTWLRCTGPGRFPLRAEFWNSVGGLGCQLLWQGPDDKTASLVPATALSHDGQPGLAAELFTYKNLSGLMSSLSPRGWREYSKRVPWSPGARYSAAMEAMACGSYTQGAQELLTLQADNVRVDITQIQVACLQATPPNYPLLVKIIDESDFSDGNFLLDLLNMVPGKDPGGFLLASPKPLGWSSKGLCAIRALAALAEQQPVEALASFDRFAYAKNKGWYASFWTWNEYIALHEGLRRCIEPQGTRQEKLSACLDGPINRRSAGVNAIIAWYENSGPWSAVEESAKPDEQRLLLPPIQALYLLSRGDLAHGLPALDAAAQAHPKDSGLQLAYKGLAAWYRRPGRPQLPVAPELQSATSAAGAGNF